MLLIDADHSEKIATCTSYLAAAANIFVGLTINDISIAIGILLAILTFLVNWYYKHRNMKLRESIVYSQLKTNDIEEDD